MKDDLFFVCRLLPPRADFRQTMTGAERELMMAHVTHLKGWLDRGKVLICGPVDDPAGSWGLVVLRVGSIEEVRRIEADDPVIKADLGFRYEVLPMLKAMVA
jgi:uncharacterized protein YciI